MEKTLELCCELISRPSVTPEDAGCQALMMQRLRSLGFNCIDLPFGDVSNFWAERGDEGSLLVFAGHTDVVPTGPTDQWHTPPFKPTLQDGTLFGRGSADVTLAENDDGTLLSYSADFKVGGKLAQVGSRLVLGATKKTANDFFGAFSRELDPGAARVDIDEPTGAPGNSRTWMAVGAAFAVLLIWWFLLR